MSLRASTAFSLFALLAASTAQAGTLSASTQFQSTLLSQYVGHVGYIWSVEVYSSCPVHGTVLYGRYFATCDINGNYLNDGGVIYAWNDIIASGRSPSLGNSIYIRETHSW